ncbi:MAG TPA: DUF3006 domain-containing protein [Longimicrobiaceae bacterium]
MPGTRRTWTVDSIEEGIASLEEDGGRMLRLPLWLLPEGVREGEVVAVSRSEDGDGGVVLTLSVDHDATERELRLSREQLARTPPGNDPGGDIVL